MKVQSANDMNFAFKASINKNTPAMKIACAYMEKCKDYEFPYKDTKTELDLFESIEKALAKHPSKEVLNIYRYNDKRFFWDERALIKSTKASLVDVEPVRDDSIAGELGIIRRILDPENKEMFNRLVGAEHSNKYDNWWKKNIAPIWENINSLYRENPAIEPSITDSQYNECFRNQIDIYESSYLNKKNEGNLNVDELNDFKDTKQVISSFIFAMLFVLGTIFFINKVISNKNVQQSQEAIKTVVKDSLNKLSHDSLDLTKSFIKK